MKPASHFFMKRILFVSVFVLAAVGMWFLCRNDKGAQRVSAGSPTLAPTETVTATPTATPTTAPTTTRKPAQPTIAPTTAPTSAPTEAPSTPIVSEDKKPTPTPAEPPVIEVPNEPMDDSDPIYQEDEYYHTDTDIGEPPVEEAIAPVDFDLGLGEPPVETELISTTSADLSQDGDWYPDFSGSDAFGDYYIAPSYDQSTEETPEP